GVQRQGSLFARLGDLLTGSTREVPPLQPAVRFESLDLDTRAVYTLIPNRQPGVKLGADLRPLPIVPGDGLPLVVEAGAELAVPLRLAEAVTLRAEAEDGSALDLAADGAAFGPEARVEAGDRAVR